MRWGIIMMPSIAVATSELACFHHLPSQQLRTT